MELIDYFTLAIFTMIGMVIGWRMGSNFHIRMFKEILNELGVTNQQLLNVAKANAVGLGEEAQAQIRAIEEKAAAAGQDLEQIEIKVEKHGDILYAFRKDNDQFLGQGADREALIIAMSQRLKNVKLTVVEGDEYMKITA